MPDTRHSKNTDYSLLDPKNDYVFKRLFSEHPDALVHLINDVRPDLPEITEIEILNPTITPSEMEGKSIVLDLLARDKQGSRYNIEMQVRRYNEWGKRSAYYLARMLTDQLVAGEDYSELGAVIGIHLLDFDLFSQNEHQLNQAVWRFEMRDQQQPNVKLDDVLQLNLIEMKKADRLGLVNQNLKDWITLFEHWHEDTIMASVTHDPVKKVRGYIRQLSSDEEARRLAFVRERAQRDEASQLRYAKNEGIAEGKLSAKRETLFSLLSMKFTTVPDWAEQKLQTADQNQLDLWIKQVLTAESLKDLLS